LVCAPKTEIDCTYIEIYYYNKIIAPSVTNTITNTSGHAK